MEGIWTLEISIWLDRLWGLEVHQVLEAPGYPKEKMIYKGKLCATPIFSETTRAGFGEPLQHQSTAVDWSRTCTKEIKASTLLLSDPSNREFKPQGVPVDCVGKFPSKWRPLTKRELPGNPKPKSDPKKPDLAGGPPAVEENSRLWKSFILCQWSEICHASETNMTCLVIRWILKTEERIPWFVKLAHWTGITCHVGTHQKHPFCKNTDTICKKGLHSLGRLKTSTRIQMWKVESFTSQNCL